MTVDYLESGRLRIMVGDSNNYDALKQNPYENVFINLETKQIVNDENVNLAFYAKDL